MKSYEEISEMFERAVEERIARLNAKRDATYLDGVTAGLGWALEEYEEAPLDDKK